MFNLEGKVHFVVDEKGNKWEKIEAWIADGYGGYFAICIDDSCYVVLQGSVSEAFKPTTHINREVFKVLKDLPKP